MLVSTTLKYNTGTDIGVVKDVHKAPALEAVGWFALAPESGPLLEHLLLQQQCEKLFNDNAIFLAIHPSNIITTETANRKLPLTIYETVTENEDTSMQVDGQEHTNVKFRQLPYTIETDETEMIAIDYVAKGAGSAAAVNGGPVASTTSEPKQDVKGKGKAVETGSDAQVSSKPEQSNLLSIEEEDQIAGITTRLNSVKMLQSRLEIINKFIQDLPPSYISDQTIPITRDSPDPSHLPHLRNIQALLTRLALLTPAAGPSVQVTQPEAQHSLTEATRSQFNDVSLISMLSQLGQNVQGLNELGRKFAQIEHGKSGRGKKNGGFPPGGYGGFDDGDGRVGGFTVSDRMLV